MKKEKELEVNDEQTSMVMEKPKMKKGKKKLIVLAIILAIIGILAIIAVPIINEEGLQGIFNPANLNKQEKKYYDLYVSAIEKYKDLKNDDGNRYEYELIYLEGVDEPVLTLSHEINKEYLRMPPEEVTLFYIKDGKVIEKNYGENSYIKPYYNIEKDEIDYYLYQVEDPQTVHMKFTVTLLKDIVTECSNPYVVKLTEDDYFLATSNRGVKTHIQKIYYVFYDYLEETFNTERRIQHEIYVGEGFKSIRHYLKKAISDKYYVNDLVNYRTWEKVNEKLSEYNLRRGQKILDSSEVSGGSCSTIVKESIPDSNVIVPDTKTQQPEKTTPSKTTPESSKPAAKCNSGFVYVSDDNKCYNSSNTKDPVTPSCQNGYTKLGPDCGKVVDSSLCNSNPDNYSMQEGQCFDNSTIYNNFPNCPNGYQYLWGSYEGQEFNGECYKYEKPNY